MLWLIFVVVVLIYSFVRIKYLQSYWQRRKIKYAKPTFLLGNFELFRTKNFAEHFDEIYKHFSDERYFGVYQFLQPTLILKDPELIKVVAVKEFDSFMDHRTFVSPDVDPVWNKNLFSLNGEQWRDLRSTLSPSFTSSKMRIMFLLMDECARQFVDHFKSQGSEIVELEVKDAACRYANDVIATTAFGLKCDSLENRDNDFYLTGKKLTDLSGLKFLKFFFILISPVLAKLLRVKVISTETADYFEGIIKETVKTREEKHIVRPDMIHLLMEAQKGRQHQDEEVKVDEGFSSVTESNLKPAKKREITTDDIVSQAILFFIAGFDTASTLIAFLLYELAVNPDVQDRLREDIKAVSAKVDGRITYELLLGIKYLDMVVSETLRKWPPVMATDRKVTKPFTIQPVSPEEMPLDLELGMVTGFPIFSLHRDQGFYPDPERFHPERFSDENKHKINPWTYLPFGLGPRNCIGSRFALLETKLFVYYILDNFEVVPVKKTNIPMVIDKAQMTLASRGGIWLGLKNLK